MTEFGNLVSQADIDNYKLTPQSTPLELGVPNYWQTAFINSKYFYTNKNDEEILKSLRDIRIEFKDDKVSFTVIFKFDPNNYFNNVELMKTYFFDDNQDLTKVEASPINWVSDEKNSTKALKKKQKKSKISKVTNL